MPNFPKNQHFLPANTCMYCAYQGIRNVRFSENLVCFVFLKHPFWDSPFWLIKDDISQWWLWWSRITGKLFWIWSKFQDLQHWQCLKNYCNYLKNVLTVNNFMINITQEMYKISLDIVPKLARINKSILESTNL